MASSSLKSSENFQLQSVGNTDKFKCSSCGKYLSIGPISSSIDCIKNFCGRCLPLGGMQRNTLYEELAKHVLFPCISPDCTELVKFNDISHEYFCLDRSIDCPISKCKIQLKITSLVKHFRSKHAIQKGRNKAFSMDSILPFNLIFNRYWMLEGDGDVYFLEVFATKDRFGVNVFNMNQMQEVKNEKFSFTVTIGNRRLGFSKVWEIIQFPWKTFKRGELKGIVNFRSSIFKTFGICDAQQSRQMKFLLKIYSPNISVFSTGLTHLDCLSIISEYLRCSVCQQSYISCKMCPQGHFNCRNCKNLETLCRICSTPYMQTFNLLTILPYIQSLQRCYSNSVQYVNS
ncbi:uncharacterized protein LOC143198137 isoform X2 [Rhynchophorus ferrugineus]|uniref:uncharacterized protein LOC143198137 isoform X2 n=1 Tax=Rhynchophorus ferrugineus TaxID=354439 RepID=UPI003FCCBC60